MSKYILIYAACYAVLAVVVGVGAYFVEITLNSGVGIGVTLASVVYPAKCFFDDFKSMPTKKQKAIFALGVLAVNCIAVAIYVFAVYLPYDINLFYIFTHTPTVLVAAVPVFAVLIICFSSYFLFGSFVKTFSKNINK
ncbi:MAG: ABZJ_00895 family protein [Campylobacteraceae bacterium]|jgi:hypothetical protein|nr:ABZJ_00895 family protein [Campylobacteraceae bacterium]